MTAGWKRMSFAVPPDLEAPLNSMKKEFFYNRTQSEMIRELVAAGMRALKSPKNGKGQRGRKGLLKARPPSGIEKISIP